MKPEALESETLTNMIIKKECNPNGELYTTGLIHQSLNEESRNEIIDRESQGESGQTRQKVPKGPITPTSTAFLNGALIANNVTSIKQESITEDHQANNAMTIKQESITEDEEVNNARLSDEEMRARIDEHFHVVTVQAYKCKECHFITTEFKLLNKHIQEKHHSYLSGKQTTNHDISNLINNMSSPSMFDDNPDAVNYSECNKTFANKKNLGSHVRAVHLQIKNHICKICNKGFFKSSKLKKHELTHNEDYISRDPDQDEVASDYISHEPDQDFAVECTPDIISQKS